MASQDRNKQAWVEIEWTVLEPAGRAPSCPPDTGAMPYLARTKGMAADAVLGSDAEVVTVTGRRMQGRVRDQNPGYEHTFGRPLPEWIRMRNAIRVLVNDSAGGAGEQG
jgi:2-amino-4-ketopentanoate thiolase alpha subunit